MIYARGREEDSRMGVGNLRVGEGIAMEAGELGGWSEKMLLTKITPG
jgi:hypothetical protein